MGHAERIGLVASRRLGRIRGRVVMYRSSYLLVLLPVAWFVIFRYMPLWNAQIAFKDFRALAGVMGSPWNGLKNFYEFFTSFYFWELIRNTLGYSFGKLIVGLPVAVALAIAVTESRLRVFRKLVQTMTYLPHFMSWVIMLGLLIMVLSPGDGLLNELIKALGGRPIAFLIEPSAFPFIVILSDLWKEMGWSAIIFIAALTSIDPNLYEAADIEGAGSLQRVRHITLPGILDVIVVVVLLRLGTILNAGFHQIFILYSPAVYSVADIIDTWVYRQGLLEFRFSLATAVGLFKGAIGLLLLLFANRLMRRYTGSGLY
jgi:putative aldouronate transport system permease protein